MSTATIWCLSLVFAVALLPGAFAGEACEKSDKYILTNLSQEQRKVWFFKDSAGEEDYGSGSMNELAGSHEVLCEDDDYETIKVKHPQHGEVWILRSGVALSGEDDAVACKAVAGASDAMGTRGLGEGCPDDETD